MRRLQRPPAAAVRSSLPGNWREYLPIAATNALLTIVTLGIYRFWATARQRRYLWSRTHVIDDSLEWTGTGKEMFVGFLIVLAILMPFFLFIQFLFPALIARGKEARGDGRLHPLLHRASSISAASPASARFAIGCRAPGGTGFAAAATIPAGIMAANISAATRCVGMTMFIMFPVGGDAAVEFALERDELRPAAIPGRPRRGGTEGRWALFISSRCAVLFAGHARSGGIVGVRWPGSEEIKPDCGRRIRRAIFLLFYLAIPLMTLHWYAKFFRKAAEATRLGDLEFGFDATTWDWLKLFLGNIALAIVTLGFGLTYWGYRNWSFMVRHAQLYGDVDVARPDPVDRAAPSEAEGFADAFDIGAI